MPFLNSEAKLRSYPPQAEAVHQKDQGANVFRAFNKHARECSRCAKPLDVYRRGDQLCDTGHHMAYEVAQVLYDIAGEKAEKYLATSGWYGIFMDLTEFEGPVIGLVKALDYNLRERKPAATQPPVFSANVRKPVSRHASISHHEGHSSSSRHHHHHHHTSSTAPAPRHEERVAVYHHRPEPERNPRHSGHIKLHVPVSSSQELPAPGYSRDAGYIEEIYHPNGGRVTTKYYHHPERPGLRRSNTVGSETTTHKTQLGGKPGSKVRFDTEIKYYT